MSLVTLLFVLSAQVDAFDFHVADFTILQDKRLQAQIKLTEAQRTKMNDAAGRQQTAIRAYIATQKAPNNDAKVREMMTVLKRNVLAPLTPSQLRRTREVSLQRIGLPAIADEVIATRIGLTGTQLAKFRKTLVSGTTEIRTLEQKTIGPLIDKYRAAAGKPGADRQKIQTEGQQAIQAAAAKLRPTVSAREEALKKALIAVLSTGQRASYQSLLGAPFAP